MFAIILITVVKINIYLPKTINDVSETVSNDINTVWISGRNELFQS